MKLHAQVSLRVITGAYRHSPLPVQNKYFPSSQLSSRGRPQSAMTSPNDQHVQYSAYFRATNLADSGDVFSFAPPDDGLPENRTYPSYLPSTQLSGMTDLSNGSISLSSHSRNLTTGPTATSVSFPTTPNSDGPPSPLPPTRNSVAEQRFDSIQSRIGPTPTTGGSGSLLFTFMPPPQDLAPSRPATSSQLSSITEFNSQSSLRPDATDREDGILTLVRSDSSIGNPSKYVSRILPKVVPPVPIHNCHQTESFHRIQMRTPSPSPPTLPQSLTILALEWMKKKTHPMRRSARLSPTLTIPTCHASLGGCWSSG